MRGSQDSRSSHPPDGETGPVRGWSMTFSSVSSQEGKQRWNPTVWGLPVLSQARVLTTALREEAREGLESTRDGPGFPFCPQLTV